MANLKLPAWRAEIKTAIDAALDAGLEGFWVDNLFDWHGEPLVADFLKELREHAARRKPNLIWHINVNAGTYHWGRAGNVVGTEDGRAPQFDAAADPPIRGNLGLLSFLSGLTAGWRAIELEHYGNNMSAATRQLIIAECWMRQAGCAWFPFDRSMRTDLHHRRPAAWKVLEAMGTYYKHQLRFAEYFRRGTPVAQVGIVGWEGSSPAPSGFKQADIVALLDYLAAWDVQFEVLFEDRLTPDALKEFQLIVVPDDDRMPPGAAPALEAWVAERTRLIVRRDSRLAKAQLRLPREAFDVKGSPGLLREALMKEMPLINFARPNGVVTRAVRQRGRVLVHFVNYTGRHVAPLPVRYRGRAQRAEVLTPESGRVDEVPLRSEGEWTIARLPEFAIHAVLALYA